MTGAVITDHVTMENGHKIVCLGRESTLCERQIS